ncbi:hypothetical protein S245_024964 [Arachis hypogaea]
MLVNALTKSVLIYLTFLFIIFPKSSNLHRIFFQAVLLSVGRVSSSYVYLYCTSRCYFTIINWFTHESSVNKVQNCKNAHLCQKRRSNYQVGVAKIRVLGEKLGIQIQRVTTISCIDG